MKIIELKAANVKRLSAVEIKPDGSLVVVGGNNGAGKSSVLDSILYALGGAGELPGVPVRNGAKAAEIELRIDSEPPMVVCRKIDAAGKTSLEIRQTHETGVTTKVTSPQKLLDSLCGKIAFDPLAFTRLPPHKQVDVLSEVVGIDLTEIDNRYAAKFEERAGYNREVKRLTVEVGAIATDTEAPTELVDTVGLLEHLELIAKANAAYHDRQQAAKKSLSDVDERKRYLEQSLREVKLSEAALVEAKADAKRMEQLLAEADEENHQLQQFADSANLTDDSETREQIAGADAANEAYRSVQRRQGLIESLDQAKNAAEIATAQLDALKADRISLMNSADWPVEGLGFSDSGVTFHVLPLEQCSSADQLGISAAIGLAQHPKLRVMLIRDGSLLDENSLASIGKLAEKYHAQVWVERVGHGEECSVIIEDGAVAPVEEDAEELVTV